MKILGWIRYGDKAACGGTVVEGNATMTSYGKPLAFTGARMVCRKNCVIVEGHTLVSVDGKMLAHHGHRTSNGCPLISTMNDQHGWANDSGEPVASEFFQNADGHWAPKIADKQYDEQTHLVSDAVAGWPYYIETNDGRVFSGRVDDSGKLPRIDTYGEDEYTVLWGDEALAQWTEDSEQGEVIEQHFELLDENDAPAEGYQYDLHRDGNLHVQDAVLSEGATEVVKGDAELRMTARLSEDGASRI